MKSRRESVPGSGLPLLVYTAILAVSVALFVVYGGLLWRAPSDASHVGRFVVSYLAVVPLAAAALAWIRRLDVTRLVTSVGSLWAIKMVITIVLYEVFAGGTAAHIEARPQPSAAPISKPHSEYAAAKGQFEHGVVTGTLTHDGKPVAGAVVMLQDPEPGDAVPAPATVNMIIAGSRYDAPVYVVHPDDTLSVESRDGMLHTVHADAVSAFNRPLRAGSGAIRLEVPAPGLYPIFCDNHPGERALLVVADHPYVTRTDEHGAFRLERVKTGDVRVRFGFFDDTGLHRGGRPLRLRTGETMTVHLDDSDEGLSRL